MEIKTDYSPTPEDSEVIRLLNAERDNWRDGAVFVTDKVQFIMRNVVKKARKNYFGIYQQENDPITGRRKIFIPFTEWIVETMLKNIDIDTKDIDVKARTTDDILASQIYRFILKKSLNDIEFGETLNAMLRRCAIDGTSFLKAEEIDGKLVVSVVDRLNMIYDPSVTLDDSSGIQERFVIPKPEFDELDLPNSEFVAGTTTVDRMGVEMSTGKNTTTEIPYVEVYARYGFLPDFVLTGKDEDMNSYSYMKAIVSGLDSNTVVHTIEKVDNHPYGDFRLKEVPNRGDGRGVPEMLFNIQAYLNEVVNIRLNKARIGQTDLYKLFGNVTPQQFKRMFASHAIKLDEQSDVVPLQTGPVDPSTYTDEERAYTWGTRVTGTTNEDEVQGNRPATNALIQQQGVSKGYNLRMEGIFLSLSKFIEKKMMPIINKNLTDKEVVRITGDLDDLKEIDQKLVKNKVRNDIAEMPLSKRMNVTPEVMQEMIAGEMKALEGQGDNRYVEIAKEIFSTNYDISITPADEELNKAVMAQSLTSVMGILAQSGLPIKDTLKELLDTLGLPAERMIKDQPEETPAQQEAQAVQADQATVASGGVENIPFPGNQVNPAG